MTEQEWQRVKNAVFRLSKTVSFPKKILSTNPFNLSSPLRLRSKNIHVSWNLQNFVVAKISWNIHTKSHTHTHTHKLITITLRLHARVNYEDINTITITFCIITVLIKKDQIIVIEFVIFN